MNNKPMIFANDDLSEGVYAASGGIGTNCWTGEPYLVQSLAGGTGGYNVYEMHLHHSKSAGHASTGCKVKYTFNVPVTNAWAENSSNYTVNFQGHDVIVSRNHFADGDYSGDEVTYKLNVKGANDAETNALGVPGMYILSCDRKATPNTGADT